MSLPPKTGSGRSRRPSTPSKTPGASRQGASGKPGSFAEKPAKTGGKPVRPDKAARPGKPVRPGKPIRPDEAARPYKAPRPGKPAAPNTAEMTAKPAAAGRSTPSGGALVSARPVFYDKRKPLARHGGAKQPAPAASASDAPPREGERIAKLLARAGIASRREVERLIAEGRVTLNDEVVETPATVLKSLKGISVDGKPVGAPAPARLFRFHKPEGLITAERDPRGRPTIYDALRNALPPGTPRVMPVGRLDLGTEGLLLVTNDGELKRAMELPSTGIPRTYRARTFGDITQSRLEELSEGIEIDGVRYGSINANMERRTGRNQWIEVTLTEGKNREVRRVLEHLGLQVSRLLRLAYGPFELGDLPRGAADEVPQVMVERFRKAIKA